MTAARSLAVLVLSCDKYADVWPGFFQCFRRYFPAGDWPVYLGSNTRRFDDPGVVTLLTGDDPDWSTSFRRILAQIPEAKLFVILEDLFLSSTVDRAALGAVVDFMFEHDAKHIRYWARPAPDAPTACPLVGATGKGAPYRATVCGFWDREYLSRMLLEGENPWNFEILGSYRASYADGFYALHAPLCEHKNLIEKGQWIPASVQWARDNGVPLDVGARPMLRRAGFLRSVLQVWIFKAVSQVPWRLRVRVMNQLRRLLVSY
jgi:hypothetical protein